MSNLKNFNLENETIILKEKAKIVQEYFTKENIIFKKYNSKYKSIVFKCPICPESDTNSEDFTLKLHLKSFIVFENDTNTCSNPEHEKKWKKIKKDLQNIWDLNKQDVVFSLNVDYINKIVDVRFPKIIRQKNTNLLFVYDSEKKFYREMVDNSEKSDIEDLIYGSFFDENNSYLTSRNAHDVKQIIKKHYKFPVKDFENSNLINCKNGVLNIDEKKLYPHSDEYFFNYISEIEYNPIADTTKLDNFITQVVTENNPISIIKRILGHVHYSGEKLQKGFLFKGTKSGRNGKGTLVKLISRTIGLHRTTTMALDQITTSDFTTYNTKDKALYIEDDFKVDYLSGKMIGFLNRMISKANETIHQKNKPQIEITHTATPLIQCNKIPKLKAEDDGGFYMRFVVINFGNEFGHADKNDEFLSSKLLENKDVMSSMLNYLVEGYHELLNRKNNDIKGSFFKEDEVSHIDEWKRENNSCLQFVHEMCEIDTTDKNCTISTRKLWLLYNNEWNLKGSKLSETKFIRIIKEDLNIPTQRITTDGNKRITKFVGLKHVDYDENDDFENLTT